MGRKRCHKKWKEKNDLRNKNSVLRKKMRKHNSQTNTNLILNNFVNLLNLKTSHSDTCSDSPFTIGGYITSTTEPCSCVQEGMSWGTSSPPLEQGDTGPVAQCWWQGRQEPCHHRALHLPCHHSISPVEEHAQMWDQRLLLWASCCLAHQLPAQPAQAAWGNLTGYSYPIQLVTPK